MPVPQSTSSCVNLELHPIATDFNSVHGAYALSIDDYSILLRDRLSSEELQEDVTAGRLMYDCDPETVRLNALVSRLDARDRKYCNLYLCLCFVCPCTMCFWMPRVNRQMAETMQALKDLDARRLQLMDVLAKHLNAKYGQDRALMCRYRTNTELTGVLRVGQDGRTATNEHKTVHWIAIELAEVEDDEKAAIKERVAQGTAAAHARLGMMLAVVEVPVMCTPAAGGRPNQVLPAPTPLVVS